MQLPALTILTALRLGANAAAIDTLDATTRLNAPLSSLIPLTSNLPAAPTGGNDTDPVAVRISWYRGVECCETPVAEGVVGLVGVAAAAANGDCVAVPTKEQPRRSVKVTELYRGCTGTLTSAHIFSTYLPPTYPNSTPELMLTCTVRARARARVCV
ncbi:hypothetical protein QBC46DRAFT_388155 [Diplogelasinospora grovesii]|uniref:Secreted protein n=1 Tax=Diplogelasinospora grovesii TaxID=303347 RepID=A0AAN6S3Q2_9PEZI|nr:hypothetical protein QBC46DRAFT_388155 [Diplogelasinospora grovesii]